MRVVQEINILHSCGGLKGSEDIAEKLLAERLDVNSA